MAFKGESIPPPTRLAMLAFAAIMFDGMAARLSAADECLDAATADDAWEAVVASEPGPARLMSEATLAVFAPLTAERAEGGYRVSGRSALQAAATMRPGSNAKRWSWRMECPGSAPTVLQWPS